MPYTITEEKMDFLKKINPKLYNKFIDLNIIRENFNAYNAQYIRDTSYINTEKKLVKMGIQYDNVHISRLEEIILDQGNNLALWQAHILKQEKTLKNKLNKMDFEEIYKIHKRNISNPEKEQITFSEKGKDMVTQQKPQLSALELLNNITKENCPSNLSLYPFDTKTISTNVTEKNKKPITTTEQRKVIKELPQNTNFDDLLKKVGNPYKKEEVIQKLFGVKLKQSQELPSR